MRNILSELAAFGITPGKCRTPLSKEKRREIEDLGHSLNLQFSGVRECIFLLLGNLKGKCECGNDTTFISATRGYLKYCSLKCGQQSSCTKTKRGNTNLLKYGAKTPLQNALIKAKADRTLEERHGVKNAFQSAQTEQTMMERYGVPHISKSVSIASKRQQTNLEKYGVEHPLQNEDIRKKAKATNEHRHGVDNPFVFCKEQIASTHRTNYGENKWPLKLARLNELWKSTLSPDQVYSGESTLYNWEHTCGFKWVQNLWGGEVQRCPKCFGVSRPQREILEFVLSLGVQAKADRKVIKPLEIDIFVPEKNIGIEVNGIFWHSGTKNGQKMANKSDLAAAKGVRLLHIWDVEWDTQREKIKNIIRTALGKSELKVHARSCSIAAVSTKDAKLFLDEFHLQGYAKSQWNYGLFHNGELLSIMTFGKSRFSKKHDFELIRFCSRSNVIVTGGAERLFSAFVRDHVGSISTYADKRLFSGALYKRLGFTFSHKSKPGFCWAKGGNNGRIVSRFMAQPRYLQKLLGNKFTPALTADQNMLQANWLQCFNIGNDVYEYRN